MRQMGKSVPLELPLSESFVPFYPNEWPPLIGSAAGSPGADDSRMSRGQSAPFLLLLSCSLLASPKLTLRVEISFP